MQLRDHGQQILEAIAADLGGSQAAEQQVAKSQGLAPAPLPARETAAQTHGVLRQKSGYDINQLASEYRALRASVLSLWLEACQPEPPHLDDMIRFDGKRGSGSISQATDRTRVARVVREMEPDPISLYASFVIGALMRLVRSIAHAFPSVTSNMRISEGKPNAVQAASVERMQVSGR